MMNTPEITAARRELTEAIAAWGLDAGLTGPGGGRWDNLLLRMDLLMVRVENAARLAQIHDDYENMKRFQK